MNRNNGLTPEPLYQAMTRPAMLLGAPYAAAILNGLVTLEFFLVTRNLFSLLLCVPLHLFMYALCLYEPRIFELIALWARTRALGWVAGTLRYWQASSQGPLPIDPPNARGRRRAAPGHIVL